MMTVGALRLIFFFIYLCRGAPVAASDLRTSVASCKGQRWLWHGGHQGILFHAVDSPTVCIYSARHRMRISLLVLFGSFAHARSFPSVSRPVFRLGPHIV